MESNHVDQEALGKHGFWAYRRQDESDRKGEFVTKAWHEQNPGLASREWIEVETGWLLEAFELFVANCQGATGESELYRNLFVLQGNLHTYVEGKSNTFMPDISKEDMAAGA